MPRSKALYEVDGKGAVILARPEIPSDVCTHQYQKQAAADGSRPAGYPPGKPRQTPEKTLQPYSFPRDLPPLDSVSDLVPSSRRREIINIRNSYAQSTLPIAAILGGEKRADLESRILYTNCALEDAARHFWGDHVRGRQMARHVFQQFAETAGALEACGWPAERVKERLEPSRKVFATSPFMRRCQEWPRGYAGNLKPSSICSPASTIASHGRSAGTSRTTCSIRPWSGSTTTS